MLGKESQLNIVSLFFRKEENQLNRFLVFQEGREPVEQIPCFSERKRASWTYSYLVVQKGREPVEHTVLYSYLVFQKGREPVEHSFLVFQKGREPVEHSFLVFQKGRCQKKIVPLFFLERKINHKTNIFPLFFQKRWESGEHWSLVF